MPRYGAGPSERYVPKMGHLSRCRRRLLPVGTAAVRALQSERQRPAEASGPYRREFLMVGTAGLSRPHASERNAAASRPYRRDFLWQRSIAAATVRNNVITRRAGPRPAAKTGNGWKKMEEDERAALTRALSGLQSEDWCLRRVSGETPSSVVFFHPWPVFIPFRDRNSH